MTSLKWMDSFPAEMWSHVDNQNTAAIRRVIYMEPEHAIAFLRYFKRVFYNSGKARGA